MKRFLKHLVLGLITMMFGIGVIGITSVKATEEEKVICFINAPTDWENPCIWAWSEDGTNAFKTWTGKMMTKDKNNEGLYYLYLPKATDHIIINDNRGTVQTAELKTEKENQGVTIKSAKEAVLPETSRTKCELSEYVFGVSVNAKAAKEEKESKPVVAETKAEEKDNTDMVVVVIVALLVAAIVIIKGTAKKMKE